MKYFYYKNGKKYQIKPIDPERMTLSGTPKIIKENLTIKRISKNLFYILLFIFMITLLSLIIFKVIFNYNNKNYNENNIDAKIIKQETLDIHKIQKMSDINYIRSFSLSNVNETDIQKYFEYMDYAKDGIYLNKQNLVHIEHPKISIVISIYNRENYVKSTIRSIQNQNLKEMEIIYIDDYSSDNSVEYIKEEQKKDPRIVLYKNKQNMGTLYSKSIGVLLAKGEYIYSLDSDDMFCSENYLNTLYINAKEHNYKFIQARALYVDLNTKKISKRKPNWMVLWAKLIETEYYRNAVYSVGYKALNNKVTVLDDDIISVFMINRGNNKLVEEIGVTHFTHPGSHVFFSRFSGRDNMKKYCLNIVTTIKTFYQILHIYIGRNYGNFLLKSHFYGGICSYFKKEDIVKELLEQYQKEREREKEKEQQREREREKENKY